MVASIASHARLTVWILSVRFIAPFEILRTVSAIPNRSPRAMKMYTIVERNAGGHSAIRIEFHILLSS